jgi:hypothetical protein
MFLLHLGSRNQFREERDCPAFLNNILCLSQSNEQTIAHPDTMAYYLEKQPNENLGIIPANMRTNRIAKSRHFTGLRL